jgi:peptidoglycan/xylan/chitin deacetylase (PgdA/CDA1 family)
MKRREFISGMGAAALGASSEISKGSSMSLHVVSLGFDDGFRKSFSRIARIYEQFSLSACFNIIASAHMTDSQVQDDYARLDLMGDFGLWNELQDRGHEIMPHGYRHAHLADLPLGEAKALVLSCLDVFSDELRGFDPAKAVFNFPYNQSSPELEEWLPSVVMGYRTSGEVINELPNATTVKVTTGGFGPGNSEQHLDRQLDDLLGRQKGWLVYNLHGLDEEGWGPIRESYLERLLARLVAIESVRIVPIARAMIQGRSGSYAGVGSS